MKSMLRKVSQFCGVLGAHAWLSPRPSRAFSVVSFRVLRKDAEYFDFVAEQTVQVIEAHFLGFNNFVVRAGKRRRRKSQRGDAREGTEVAELVGKGFQVGTMIDSMADEAGLADGRIHGEYLHHPFADARHLAVGNPDRGPDQTVIDEPIALGNVKELLGSINYVAIHPEWRRRWRWPWCRG